MCQPFVYDQVCVSVGGGGIIIKIVRRTTGAKGCYFLTSILQVSSIFITHLLKSLTSPLQISKSLLQDF